MKLAKRKTRLSFTTNATFRYRGREREIVVEPEPEYVTVRLSGTRLRYSASWVTVYQVAAEIYARRERDRRKTERIARKRIR